MQQEQHKMHKQLQNVCLRTFHCQAFIVWWIWSKLFGRWELFSMRKNTCGQFGFSVNYKRH